MNLAFAPLMQVGSKAMDRLRITIHENEQLNQVAHRIRECLRHFFASKMA